MYAYIIFNEIFITTLYKVLYKNKKKLYKEKRNKKSYSQEMFKIYLY